MNRRQTGVALISVLLVMSLALLILGAVLHSHRLLVKSSAQQLQQLHLRQLATAGEAWALRLLQDSPRGANPTLDLSQEWARAVPGFDTNQAQVQIEIHDLAGRLNLNRLLAGGRVDQVTLERWTRLLALLDLPPLVLPQAGALHELSQLRLLAGIDGLFLQQLEPWVALLPADAAFNVNTAPALLLRTLGDLGDATAQALARQREADPWATAQAFTRDPLLAGLEVNGHGLGVDSRWLRIEVSVSDGDGHLRLSSDVERDAKTGQLNVLQRRLLPSIDPRLP